MRFIVIGAGGIGAYYGARLLQAGHQVVFVARGQHLSAMRKNGLRIIHPEFDFHGAVTACDQEELTSSYQAEKFDLILISLKASQTAEWLMACGDWLLSGNTPLLSLQNGVDNELQIEDLVGRGRTVGGLAVRIGGHVVSPGKIEATGPAEIVMGAWPNASSNPALQTQLKPMVEAFNAADIPTVLTPRIQHELWLKLLINNGVNPLSALTGLDTRALTGDPIYGDNVYRLMEEAAAAARADGVIVLREEIDRMYQLICNFDAIKTSMLVDREKNRPLEIDAICGAVLQRSRQQNSPAPLTGLVDALLRDAVGLPHSKTPLQKVI